MNEQLFHEVWWIFSLGHGPNGDEPWGGLHIATFSKAINSDTLLVVIHGETDRRRIGVRIWDDIHDREGWVKVAQIAVPTEAEVKHALDAKLYEIAAQITEDVMGRAPDR